MPIPILAPNDEETPFPHPNRALIEPNGLLMAGGSLSTRRLQAAYQTAIFPWFEEGEPILWWSPDPRCVIWPEDIRITRSLRKTIRKGSFQVTENQAYKDVMLNCSALRKDSSGTWISPSMIDAYCRLHAIGVANSVEVWQEQQLVGGLYGVKVGAVFVGESMFSKVSDASKVALVHLAQSRDYKLIDCQLETAHLISMGASTMSRNQYLAFLQQYGEP